MYFEKDFGNDNGTWIKSREYFLYSAGRGYAQGGRFSIKAEKGQPLEVSMSSLSGGTKTTIESLIIHQGKMIKKIPSIEFFNSKQQREDYFIDEIIRINFL
mgnify:CR=1 FL=1